MVRHSIPHALGADDAKQLLDRAFAHYRDRYPKYEPTLHWLDTRRGEIVVSIRGYKLTGRIELAPAAAVIEMHVPMLLRPFQGTAVRAIDREANKWLNPDEK
jgi:hypothetical protein